MLTITRALFFSTLCIVHVDSRRFKVNIYADNWVRVWVNGREVCTDPVSFVPHNLNSFEFEDGKCSI